MPVTVSTAIILALLGASPASIDPSESIGHPFSGQLRGGVALIEDTDAFHLRWRGRANRWVFGTLSLVQGIRWTADNLDDPTEAPLLVGNLSRQRGGDLPCSRSHNTGRDVDFGLFMTDAEGRPVQSRYYRFDAEGRSLEANGRYRFDDARNWQLVVSLLQNPWFEITLLVLNPHLEDRLITYAQSIGEAQALVDRAAALLDRPSYANLHRNHLHVRIACPQGHDRCVN